MTSIAIVLGLMRRRRSLIVIAALVAIVAGGALANFVLIPALGGGTKTIAGTVPPAVTRSVRLQPLPGNKPMTVSVVLRPKGGLKNLFATADAVSDPGSPQYGNYLSPAQVRARFAPSSDTVRALEDYLRSRGLSIVSTESLGRTMTVSGSESSMEGAFGVRLYQWRDRATGRFYFANQSPIALPAALAAEVMAVSGLDSYLLGEPAGVVPLGLGGPSLEALLTAYNVKPLINSSACPMFCRGYGETVAIYAIGGFQQANIDTFDSGWHIPPADIKVSSFVDIGQGSCGPLFIATIQSFEYCNEAMPASKAPNEMEAEADIETVHAIAPGATIHVYEFPTGGNSTFFDKLQAFLTEIKGDPGRNRVVSISYGHCEYEWSPPDRDALSGLFGDLSSQGQSVFVASGDTGQICTKTGGLPVKDVNYPASDPRVTSVGGTHLDLNDSTYKDEQAWDKGNSQASGGGKSSYFSKPSWQRSLSAGLSYTNRLVPDVAANAAQDSALGVCAYGAGPLDCWGQVGGASVAAPLWAGIAAIFDQYAKATGGFPLGFANSLLYDTALHDQAFPPLVDITHNPLLLGTGDLFGLADKGWDFATGLGTPDAYNLIRDLNPTLQIFPSSGPSGTIVYLSAAPFHTGDTVSFYLLPPNVHYGVLLCKAKADGQQVAGCSATIRTTAAQGTSLKVFAVDPNVPRQARSDFAVKPAPRAYVVTVFNPPGALDQAALAAVPLNLTTNTLGTPVPLSVGGATGVLGIAPDGNTAYVSTGHFPSGYCTQGDGVPGAVVPFDLLTNSPGNPIPTPSGTWPLTMAITPDGRTAYVTTGNCIPPTGTTGDLMPIDLTSNTPGATIPMPSPGVPAAIAITPDGKTAYVTTTFGNGAVVPINLVTNTLGTPIPIPSLNNPDGTPGVMIPDHIAIRPDGKTAYVTNYRFDENSPTTALVPINLVTNTPGPAIQVSGITGIIQGAITPDGKTAYAIRAGSAGNAVVPIDLVTNKPGTPIPAPVDSSFSDAIAITPDGTTAYVISLRYITQNFNAVPMTAVVPINLMTNELGTPSPLPAGTDVNAIITSWVSP